VKFGRPDLPSLISGMRKFAISAGEKRVAVLSCGPVVMVDDLRDLCWDMSDNEVAFDFHGEVFEF
jgi:Ferric reductase NAD binding domain